MNLIEQLSKELEILHLNEFEKVIYIYLRCCEIFSFDSRWYYADVYDEEEKLREKLLTRTFNVENIDSKEEVLCKSFSIHILKPLIEYFTNLPCEIGTQGTHVYVVVEYKGVKWKLDATLCDLQRVKLEIPTTGFTSGRPRDAMVISEIDSDLGYCQKTMEEYRSLIHGENNTECVKEIAEILENSKAKYHYSDAVYLYDDVLGGRNYSENNKTYLDRYYNFHKLVDVQGEYSYFELAKHGDEFSIKKIRPIEYKVLTKYFRCK